MNKNYGKRFKKLLCWCCILSLCITCTAMAAANIGDVYTLADGSLSLRVCGGDSVMVCGYDGTNNSKRELNIEPEYKLAGPDGNIHTDDNGNQINFCVAGIEDGVFAQNQVFKYINIKTNTGMKIGKSAFEWVEVQESGVHITGRELAELGESAFANSNIQGNMTIENINGSIGAGAFRNMRLSGRLWISGIIDTLEDYSLAGISLSGLSMPSVICHMGNGVYKDTQLGSKNIIPLSNSLKTIGSRVFEGTGLMGIRLPECDTVEYAASDAFEEGMLIVIPEGLSNLEVFHFDQYQNLTFQTAEGLSDNSPIIKYLNENRLVYKKGENGELIYPQSVEEPDIPPTETPEVTETPKPTEAPTEKPVVAETPKPTEAPTEKPVVAETPKPTEAPTEKPAVAETPKPMETPKQAETARPSATSEPSGVPVNTEKPVEGNAPETKPSEIPGDSTNTGVTETPLPVATQPPVPSATPARNTATQYKTEKNTIYKSGKLKYRLLGKNKVSVTGLANKKITSISIPGTVTIKGKLYQVDKIEKQAFKGMKYLKKANTGNGVKKIEDGAFAKCTNLESIQFGTGLTSIGKKVLYKDKNIRSIIFKGTKLKKIGKKTFSGIRPEKVTIKVKKSKMEYYQKLISKAK